MTYFLPSPSDPRRMLSWRREDEPWEGREADRGWGVGCQAATQGHHPGFPQSALPKAWQLLSAVLCE